jgi:hypothetical protein
VFAIAAQLVTSMTDSFVSKCSFATKPAILLFSLFKITRGRFWLLSRFGLDSLGYGATPLKF